VAKTVEDMGVLLAGLVRYLHQEADMHYDDVYVIGHSLGAQIAGSAGKQIKPHRFNTIYALDPAGPQFREKSDGEFRMGGEPSIPKNGTFYVKTYSEPPYAMGHRWQTEPPPREEKENISPGGIN